ncbi:MAG: hypothetical protein AAF623_12605 [Planctomycetota bacterium]
MNLPNGDPNESILDQVLGYLNFSNGNHDGRFFSNLNAIFSLQASKDSDHEGSIPLYQTVLTCLRQRLTQITESNPTFKDSEQAKRAIEIAGSHLLPSYLDFHADLLFHQETDCIFNSFFLGRAFERVLANLRDEKDNSVLCQIVIKQLNDFVGHRPVAVLENQKMEPDPHEWIRPVPIYIQGAGYSEGKYKTVTQNALQLIESVDPAILRAAKFDPKQLQELSFDPRAFDFDHPINQRPNHHFGHWDAHSIDNSGYYYRFIVHQVTLDALLERAIEAKQGRGELHFDEAMLEAAAVLAGTILMASGISGDGPGAYDSNTTLKILLPVIASYRDQFYENLIEDIPPNHRQRLLKESEIKHQPFGAVRQDLNAKLAQRRASQLVNCRLASIFARMGYPEAAEEQSKIVPVASARINCQLDCILSLADQALKAEDLDRASQFIDQVMSQIRKGIRCGAIVDPWNILGFEANYSLFPAIVNTVRDHRIYDLVDVMERIFAFCSQLWSEAAAVDRIDMCKSIRSKFQDIVHWWRKFSAHTVSSLEAVDPEDIFQAAELVAQALNLWHKGGAAAGDIEFWTRHSDLFDSPKAYSLVVDALMQRADYKTSMALLIRWISQADSIPLQHGDSSFHDLVFRWIAEQTNLLKNRRQSPDQIWERIRKFHDYLEANSEAYWDVPRFDLTSRRKKNLGDKNEKLDSLLEDDRDDEKSIYSAAYEEVTYTDSTDDGMESSLYDESLFSNDALEYEVARLSDRLEFLGTLASYWKIAATVPLPVNSREDVDEELRSLLCKRREIISGWVRQANHNRSRLLDLLDSINNYHLRVTGSDHESLLRYDQQRLAKDGLLERTISTCIETENAVRGLAAVILAVDYLVEDQSILAGNSETSLYSGELNGSLPVVSEYASLLLKSDQLAIQHFEKLTLYLADQPILYVPLSKGGDPAAIVRTRVVQTAILDLLRRLPLLGLLVETYELTSLALAMEKGNPVGRGAVTEFDEIFEVAYTSMVHALVRSTERLRDQRQQEGLSKQEVKEESQTVLFECVEMLTESMLMIWLDHSKTLRLSVVEKVLEPASWERLVGFIKEYGGGLFTQHFLHVGNIRAILHQGVDNWMEQVEQDARTADSRLFRDLGGRISRQKAIADLTLVLESVIENYNEYRDYNTTTTQSDRGESLYMLIDFLRLRTRYDRVCWNLKPVVWAHRILVNDQKNGVARMWRRSLVDRVGPESLKYLEQLEKLRSKYSMLMASVGRRIEGRFGHQMQIDRLKALVKPAMKIPRDRKANRSFDLLKHEAQTFSRTTMGVGIDLPAWLADLENEVEQFLLPQRLRDPAQKLRELEPDPIPIALLKEELEKMPGRSG